MLGGSSAGRSRAGVPDESGTLNRLGGPPLERDRSAGRAWMGCDAWKYSLGGARRERRTTVDGV